MSKGIKKGIKIILSLLSAVIMTLIIVPIVLSLLLNLESVQNWVVDYAARTLSKKAETTVSIDHVRLRLFNRISLDGVYVEDYHGDTLIYAENITVPFRSYSFVTGTLALGAVALDSAQLYLMQDSTGVTNLKQILDRLKNPDKVKKKSRFRLTASSLEINGMVFQHRKKEIIPREYGVNFTDIGVERFDFKGRGIGIIKDSINVNIERIAVREKSGLEVNSLSARSATVSGSGMWFEDMAIETPDSHVEMNSLSMEYGPAWSGLRDFLNDVHMEADLENSTVAFSTIAYFAPSLRDWKSAVTGFTGTVSGTVADMQGHIASTSVRDTRLGMHFKIMGIPEIDRTKFTLDIAELSTDSGDIEFIYEDITRKKLDSGALDYVRKMREIHFGGRFDGYLSDFKADGLLSSAQGDIDLDLSIRPETGRGRVFAGNIKTTNFDLGDLLDIPKMEDITVQTNFSGAVNGTDISANTTASVPQFRYNGYTYHDINLSGVFENRAFEGHVASEDENLNFTFDGRLDFNDSVPVYNFDLDLANADLYALNFNKRDTVSVIRTTLTAQGSGFDIDNLNGEAVIGEMIYINHVDTVRTGEIRFAADNKSANRVMGMYSSFADLELKGQTGFNHMISYLTNTLMTYLPSISPERTVRERMEQSGVGDASGYYVVTLNVKEANNVAGILLPGLQLAEGSRLSFLFNPDQDQFSLTMNSDYIERGNFLVSGLNVSGRNEADSISVYIRADDFFAGNAYLPDLSIIGGAKNNRVNIATRFNNTENGTYALLRTTSSLGTDSVTGIPQVRIDVLPSTITVGSQTWDIMGRDIVIDSTKVAVGGFRIVNGPQQLTVDGVASHSMADTIHLQMDRFDLRPLSNITSRQGYDITGKTTGHADMMSAFGDGLLFANMNFDSVSINGISVPDTRFASSWDFQAERAGMSLLASANTADTIVSGYYRPTDKRYFVRASFDSLPMAMLNPFLDGVTRGTEGYAEADVTITNPNGKPQFDGKITVQSASTTVEYTNVKYTMRNVVAEFRNSVLTIPTTRLLDPEGNGADFSMTLNLQNFSNITYDVRVRPQRTLVLNTTMKENEVFYGKVYASGAASITGDRRGVNIDITASTDDNSSFFMPLGSTATASVADFIEFYDPNALKGFDSLSPRERRKLMIEQRFRKRAEETQSNMDIKMTLTVRPNTALQIMIDQAMDNVIRGRGSGTLNIHVNPNNNIFTMYGECEITEGSYRFALQNNLLTKNFTIMPGSNIQWTGDPVDAMLNISAVYNLKASLAPLLSDYSSFRSMVPVECIIMLTDRLTQPEITFDVQVPSADTETSSLIANALNTQEMKSTQFLSLLVTNGFMSESSGGTNIGSVATASTGFDFLSNQLSRMLSTERFSLVPKYRPKTTTTSDEIGLAFSAELVKDRLTIDVDGNYDTGNVNTAMANTLTGDVYVNWLLDPAGSVQVKAFTRTIDRFDENQGMQESGLGISYKEDFDNAQDLWQKIKNRFRSRKKKNAVLNAGNE